MPNWRVDVEVLVLRLAAGRGLEHRWMRAAVTAGASPDERAVALTHCAGGLCHSTSWRLEAPGTLVLTYAVLPDPEPGQAAAPLERPLVVAGGQALRPSPVDVARCHVAAHAVRHLADLARRDPVVRELARRDEALWVAIADAARATRHELEQAS